MTKASPTELKDFQSAAASVYQAYKDGQSPTDAVIKVAGDHGYNLDWTRRLCEVTNRLLTVDHMANAPENEKAASHVLVDIDRVMSEKFPTELSDAKSSVKSASLQSAEPRKYTYADLVMTEKRASAAETEDGEYPLRRPFDFPRDSRDVLFDAGRCSRSLKKASELLDDQRREAVDRIGRLAKSAAAAIRSSGITPAELEESAIFRFGEDARAAMDVINLYGGFTRFEKSASPRIHTTDPWDTEPYKSVADVIYDLRYQAITLPKYESMAKAAAASLEAVDMAIAGLVGQEKQAGPPTPAWASMLIGEDTPKSKDEKDFQTAGIKSSDVAFFNNIRSRQALAGALRDPVIRKYDAKDITRAYNRNAETAPRAFMNEATLIAVLRQALEQPDQSPFDMQQMQTVEKGLAAGADITNPSNK